MIVEEADSIRLDILNSLKSSGGGHYGGSLSVVDILIVLFRRIINIRPADPQYPLRDRLILSKGHAAIALYVILARLGYFPKEYLSTYAHADSQLEGHPDMNSLPGIDFSTGSLGQGLSVGLGMALALRPTAARTWVVLGDGECQEGQVWEAAMLAARYKLKNLHAIVDANGYQEWGWQDQPELVQEPVPNIVAKWSSFGWRVIEAKGHDHDALTQACIDAQLTDEVPSVIIAHTIKGSGINMIERDPIRFHCAELTQNEHDFAVGTKLC